jgi:hypothetical protein
MLIIRAPPDGVRKGFASLGTAGKEVNDLEFPFFSSLLFSFSPANPAFSIGYSE